MKKLFLLALLPLFFGCKQDSVTEKYHKHRNNIINVSNKIRTFDIEEVLIGNYPGVAMIHDYIIIVDFRSTDTQLHLVNKNNFRYHTSVGQKGEGPAEITNIGHLGINGKERIFYVTDHGKQVVFEYNLDSVLVNPGYTQSVKARFGKSEFPARYHYMNDSLCIGLIIEPVPYKPFNQVLAKWNMATGEIRKTNYTHPEIERKRVCFAVSEEHNMYVECYNYHDLMTICTLDEKLLYNIYGKSYDNTTSNSSLYYSHVQFCGDKIFATYLGGDTFYKDNYGEIKSNEATKFHIFDLKGEYIKTLETGQRIIDFVYDDQNNRLILVLNEESQFAYLDLNGLI